MPLCFCAPSREQDYVATIMKALISFAFVSLLAFNSAAQLVLYTFDIPPDAAPSSNDPNVDATDFSPLSGAHFTPCSPSSGNGIEADSWTGADGVRWCQFTVSAAANHVLNLSSLQFDDHASATGPIGWSVTINGTPVSVGQPTHFNFSPSPMNTVDLSGNSFQGLSSALIKIFGFDAPVTDGTWCLDNVALNGSVAAAVPEPQQCALFVGLSLVGFAAYRRCLLRVTKSTDCSA